MDKKLIIDLEMCKIPPKVRKKGDRYLFTEIIQIGAVILDEENNISDTFGIYVRPQLGEIDEEIEALTGISMDMVKDAPFLADALNQMCQWMAGRQFHVLSWSDNDYFQLLNEMRSKKLRNRTIDRLFENWSDLQKSFSEMINLDYILSLDRVLEASGLSQIGKLHDGLDDAYNTARIVQKIQNCPYFELTYTQIEEKEVEVEHLNSSLGNFFSADILKQFALLDPALASASDSTLSSTAASENSGSGVSSSETTRSGNAALEADIFEDYHRLLFSTDRDTGDCWPLYHYQHQINGDVHNGSV